MTSFYSTNPMTKELLWQGKEASEKDVDHAVDQARSAFSRWSSISMEERQSILRNFQTHLNKQSALFSEWISKETGKPLWESKEEVKAMITKVDIAINAQHMRCKTLKFSLADGTSITRHKPLGVVAVLGPYNFPGHLPNGHIVPALLAGNTVVFKSSERTPKVAEEMIAIWKSAGLPDGVLNLLQGGQKTGKMLSLHSGINALLFTGNWKTGKILAEQLANRPSTLLALEMGGNNPLVIGNLSNLKAAAYYIIESAFLSSGQRCTCARRLIVPSGKKGDAIIDALLQLLPKMTIGAYHETPEPFMGPVIDMHAANNLLTVQSALNYMGANVLHAMDALRPGTPLLSPGLIDVSGVSNRPDEEYFGPLLQVIRVPDFDSAIVEANRTRFGLAAGLLSDDPKQYEAFYRRCHAGIINWNTATTGASSQAPFGGVGQSGNYRPTALYAADYCNYPIASIEVERMRMPKKIRPGLESVYK